MHARSQIRQYFLDSSFYIADVTARGWCKDDGFPCEAFSPSSATVKVRPYSPKRCQRTKPWVGLGFVIPSFVTRNVEYTPKRAPTPAFAFRYTRSVFENNWVDLGFFQDMHLPSRCQRNRRGFGHSKGRADLFLYTAAQWRARSVLVEVDAVLSDVVSSIRHTIHK